MGDKFIYTYSAKQDEDVECILKKYLPMVKNDDKVEEIKRLDRLCERPATITAVIVGIFGIVILCSGIYLVFLRKMLLMGAVIGLSGLICMAVALPVYALILESRKKKIAPMIISLGKEVMGKESLD